MLSELQHACGLTMSRVTTFFFLYFSSPHGRWIRACLYLVSESPSGTSPAVLPQKEGGGNPEIKNPLSLKG